MRAARCSLRRMELRLLDENDLDAVFETYLEAFSDYSIPVNPPREAFDRMLQRRGAVWPRSVAAFDGERMVGLQVTALGEYGYEGTPTAYDVFTGVIPSHRGQGLAGQMFSRVLEELRPGEAEQFLLECIVTNERALSAYRKQGFEITRKLECFELEVELLEAEAPAANVAIREVSSPQWVRLADLHSWQASWQNARQAMERAVPPPLVIGAFRDEQLVGYAALFPDSGDLAQLAVGPEHHREGIGSALFASCVRRLAADVNRIRAINVPADAEEDLAFLRARRAEVFTQQFEMVRKL